MTYLYYRNGCEFTCGTEDVVFLQNGKVVDAVLRWPGHRYSGQSSSPAATQPHLRRSEEHTSELQSRPQLVCRLLLEKKTWPGRGHGTAEDQGPPTYIPARPAHC